MLPDPAFAPLALAFLAVLGASGAVAPVARGEIALYGVVYAYTCAADGRSYTLTHGRTVLRAALHADGGYRLTHVGGPRPASSLGFQTLVVEDGRLVVQRRRAA